ncbi:MAG: hypothetical protein LBC07_02295, partial [Elusimicrobiota bacterium]|nr:hypothetical protein [Elusimicrobiota bacterium]
MKKYIIVVSFLSLIAGLAIFYGSAQFLYHLTRKDLQAQAVQNVTSAAKSQASIIDAAITTGDNVRLMSEVIALARIEGVASVFILDSSHNLIASSDRLERSNLELENAIENALLRTKSNGAEMAQEILPEAEAPAPESAQNSNVQTQENAAQQPGAYSENALATGQVQPANITNTQEAAQAAEVPQEAPPSKTKRAVVPTAILYSLPLGADNMLFVEISLQDVTTLSAHWRNWYYYPIFGLAVILLIIVFYIFASLIIGIPFRRLNKKLEKAEKIIALSKESANAAQTPPAESEQTSKEEPAVEPM